MDPIKRPRIHPPSPSGVDDESLPEGWEMFYSERKQRHYYFHAQSGRTQWTLPVPPRPKSPPTVPPSPPSTPEFAPSTTVDSPPYDPTLTDRPEATDSVVQPSAPYDPTAAATCSGFQFGPPPSTTQTTDIPAAAAPQGLVIDESDAYGDVAYASQFEDRNASHHLALRRTCNFLKEGLIRAAVAVWSRVARRDSVHVLDLACGRGGDFDKFRRAARDAQVQLRKLAGVEVSTGAFNIATDRLNKVLASSRDLDSVQTEAHLFKVGLHTGNTLYMLRNNCEKKPTVEERFLSPGTYHIASCMFALHYFFFNLDVVKDLMRSTSHLLHEGGIFIAIYADGQAVERAYQAAKESGAIHTSKSRRDARESFQVGRAWIRIHPSTAAYLSGDPRAGTHHTDRAYDFDLPGSVNDVKEYMVHPEDRDAALAAAGLVPLVDEPAPRLLASMLNLPFWQDAYRKCKVDGVDGVAPVDDITMQQVSLYRALVCVKSSSMMSDVPLARQAVRRVLGLEDAFIAPATTT